MRALDATIETMKADGSARSIPIGEFHRLPGDTPHLENALEAGELITAVILPSADLEPDGRLGRDRPSQDAWHCKGEGADHLAVHRRRFRRQVVLARGSLLAALARAHWGDR